MKAILSTLIFLFTAQSFAHCPIPLETETGKHCMDYEWQNGDRMVKGQLESVSQLSPVLNAENEIPQKWIYSRALVRVWVDGDKTHAPVQLENFRVFPYMTMVNGMHHSVSSQWNYNESQGGYVLSGFAMQEMLGCWSLRWTLIGDDSLEGSTFIKDLVEYANLDLIGNTKAANVCAVCTSQPLTPPPAEAGHHHH